MWLSLLAFLGFVSSLIIHISTFRNVDPALTLPLTSFLFCGIFVIAFSKTSSTSSSEQREQNWYRRAITMPLIQNCIKFVLLCIFVYMFVNTVLCSFLSFSSVGGLADPNGNYVIQLQNYHPVIRKLTSIEQYRQKVYTVRSVSGFNMIFYLLPSLGFWFTKSEEVDK